MDTKAMDTKVLATETTPTTPLPSSAATPSNAPQPSTAPESTTAGPTADPSAGPTAVPMGGGTGSRYTSSEPQSGEGFSVTSFVLGIYAIVSGNLLAALVGLIFGIIARKRPGTYKTLNLWGIVLNSVALALALLIAVAVIFFIFFFFAAIVGTISEVGYYNLDLNNLDLNNF